MRKYFNWIMLLTVSTYLIIGIALAILLTGCSEFETKINNMSTTTQYDGLQE
tara:strand:+ start:1576 stop:1731 length:156 start_codon:yes stop_codon:yes gene_type:complete